jgi:hypothetical protein
MTISHSFQPHDDIVSRYTCRKHFFSPIFDMRCDNIHGFGWA